MMATMDLGAQGVDDEVSLQTENVLTISCLQFFTLSYRHIHTSLAVCHGVNNLIKKLLLNYRDKVLQAFLQDRLQKTRHWIDP